MNFEHPVQLNSIFLDLDSECHFKCWKRLYEKSGMKLKLSTSTHTQTYKPHEIINEIFEIYLSCYWFYYQDEWSQLLPPAELAYNSVVSKDLEVSPFEMDLGWKEHNRVNLICEEEVLIQRLELDRVWKRLKSSLHAARFSRKNAMARKYADSSHR